MKIQTVFANMTDQAELEKGFEPLEYDSNDELCNYSPDAKPATPARN